MIDLYGLMLSLLTERAAEAVLDSMGGDRSVEGVPEWLFIEDTNPRTWGRLVYELQTIRLYGISPEMLEGLAEAASKIAYERLRTRGPR